MQDSRRYPMEPLEKILRPQLESRYGSYGPAVLARALGLGESSGRQQVYNLRDNGLSHRQADRFAVKVGLLPYTVWPDWLHDPPNESMAGEDFWSDKWDVRPAQQNSSGISANTIVGWLSENPGSHAAAEIAQAVGSEGGVFSVTSTLTALVRAGEVQVMDGHPKTYSRLVSGIPRSVILDKLKANGSLTIAELARQLGKDEGTVEAALQAAKKGRQVQQVGRSWQLVAKGVHWTKKILLWLQENPGAHTASDIASGVGAVNASAVTAGLSSLVKSERVLRTQQGNKRVYSASGFDGNDDDNHVKSKWADAILEHMRDNPGAALTAGDIATGVQAKGGASAMTAGIAALVKAGALQQVGQIRGKASYRLVQDIVVGLAS